MRILTLIHEYPPIGGGGGRAAMDIARDLVRRNNQVKVVTAHIRGMEKTESDEGVEVIRVSSLRHEMYRANFLAMLGFVIAGFWKSFWLILRWKPDLIHVHFAVPAGAAAWLLSVLTGVPYVITVQLGDVPGLSPAKTDKWFRWVKPFTPMIWRRAAGIVAVSEWVRDRASAVYGVPIQVIHNGVPLAQFDPGKIQVNHPPRIMFAGRLVEQKNLLLWVKVLGAIADLEWDSVLIGDGHLRLQIEAELERCHIHDRVQMPGWIPPEEVLAHSRNSDILFLPSLSEGLPLVGVQALAMGLAMVVSDAGGNVDVVQPGINGVLHAPEDAAGFEQSLRMLLTDSEKLLRFRLASREFAKKFDNAAITEQYERVFCQVFHRG